MSGRPSFRVYFVHHADGRYSGYLMRKSRALFAPPPPSAYGRTPDEVLLHLETQLLAIRLEGKEPLASYLWEESFEVRRASVPIHPQAVVKKSLVIGKDTIPLRLSYAFCPLEGGGFRVVLPRFDWWMILEDLATAGECLASALGAALLGEQPRWIYDFRQEGEEYVHEWETELNRGATAEQRPGTPPVPPVLAQVTDELVERARRGKLPLVVGLEDNQGEHEALLARDPLPSLLLVGGPGVGKTTWVRRLARRLAGQRKGRAPRIWATSKDRLVAGMIYLGMWQQRCLELIAALSQEGDFLYVDRLTSLLEELPDGSSIGELLEPAVVSGEIALIAECSEPELERCRRRAPRLVDSCQIIRVPEVAAEAMPPLLQQYQQRRGAKVTLHPQALRLLVRYLLAFHKDVRFPGKGFRFMDWLTQDGAERASLVYARDLAEIYSRYSGLPAELISDEHPVAEQTLAARLAQRVIGQPTACALAARVLARFKAGLNDPEKPCGSLFLVGPTGVGKTELAKQLARTLFGSEERMIRLDMSEYMTPGSAQRLLAVGAGVRSLAERLREQPLSLLLLDEIEKAHPEVFDLLLGLLGEGRLTDTLGRLVDARMSLIVLTSNLGVEHGHALGFEGGPRADYERAVRRHFRPEFFNRIDHVIAFSALSRADIEHIVDLSLESARERTGLLRRNLRLEVDPEARRLLARLGYHPTFGARPLKRLIEERVITPIAVRMARDPDFKDRTIRVLAEDSAALSALSPEEAAEVITLHG